jgi:hypothetical protein
MCKILQVLNWTKRKKKLNTKVIEQLKNGEIEPVTDYYFWLGEDAEEFHSKTMERINAKKGVPNPDETYKESLNDAVKKWGIDVA